MNSFLRDLRCAFRVLLKSRGFTSAAVLSLALGIGASSAVFSVVYAVLIRALPYKEPQQIMVLKNALLSFSGPPSYTNVFDWNQNVPSFSDLAAYSSSSGGANLTDPSQPERVEGAEVTAGFFTTMAVSAVQGRVFEKGEDQPGKNAVVVVSYGLWQRRFGAEESIVGRPLTLNGKVVTVIGIAPFGFEFPGKCDFWIPLAFGKDRLLSGQPGYQIIGRLKPGIKIDQAQAEINVFIQKLKADQPGLWVAKRGIQVIPLLDQLVSGTQTSFLILSGFVALVLLISCSNVANLFLARAANRKKEIAIRVALGARRFAVIQQLLVESLLLSFAGGALGLIAGSWLLKILIALIPNTIPRIGEVRLDAQVLIFTLVISIVTSCLVGLAPALQALKVDINESLKEGALTSSTAPGSNTVRSLLVVSEIVLTVVILAGAGLLLKSLIQIHKTDPGFNPESVITFNISLPETHYSTREQKASFFQDLISRLPSTPGILSVGAINFLPLGRSSTMLGLYEVEGQVPTGRFENQLAAYLVVTPDYFKAMGIPLIQGRYLAEQDTASSLLVVLIDQTIARDHWPNESPIGKRLMLPGESTPREIVGVVGTVQHLGLDIDAPKELYLPYTQSALSLRSVVIRTSSDPLRTIEPVSGLIQTLDKNLPIYDIATMHQRLDESTVQRRFIVLLFCVFAGAALILTAVGIFGVMAYTVAQRNHEIGVRIALGAQQSDVLKLILGTALRLAFIGVVLGIGASLILTRAMSSMLFGVTTFDPATLCLVSTGILGVALLASYLPAVRATRVDPIVALRNQ